PRKFQTAQIERLCHQRGLVQVQKIAVRVGGVRVGIDKQLAGLTVERSDVDSVMSMANVIVAGSEIKEVMSVGKEIRPAVTIVQRKVHMRDKGGSTASRRHLVQAAQSVGGEQNNSLTTPTPALSKMHITHG